ncbi:hypothetical protein ACGFSD_05775 [Streptomyces caniferus]|uniref:hypothetical protein n=1 Tax=Streptomyces caniferus TaxID=285557 RepID=UPI0037222045
MAKWQQNTSEADAHVRQSPQERYDEDEEDTPAPYEQGEEDPFRPSGPSKREVYALGTQLVAEAIAGHLDGAPLFAQEAKAPPEFTFPKAPSIDELKRAQAASLGIPRLNSPQDFVSFYNSRRVTDDPYDRAEGYLAPPLRRIFTVHSVVDFHNKVANVIVSNGGRAFIGAIASKSASDATRIFDYLGKKGAKVVTGTVTQSKIPGKVLQGAVALATHDWSRPSVRGQSHLSSVPWMLLVMAASGRRAARPHSSTAVYWRSTRARPSRHLRPRCAQGPSAKTGSSPRRAARPVPAGDCLIGGFSEAAGC